MRGRKFLFSFFFFCFFLLVFCVFAGVFECVKRSGEARRDERRGGCRVVSWGSSLRVRREAAVDPRRPDEERRLFECFELAFDRAAAAAAAPGRRCLC